MTVHQFGEKYEIPERIRIHKYLPLMVIVAALCFSLSVAGRAVFRSPESRICFVPDDACYYLGLARNFAEQGIWSFDSGTSVTTGFHLLYAYLLAAVYRLFSPGAETFIQVSVLLSYLFFLGAFGIGAAASIRLKRLFPALVLCLFVLSRNVSLGSISGVEWSSVVFFSSLLFAAVYTFRDAATHGALIAVFIIGFMGSLARSDFGMAPAALFGAALLERIVFRNGKMLSKTFVGLCGAGCGTGLVMVHNYWVGGSFLQSSAMMKSLWIKTGGQSFRPLILRLLSIFGPKSYITVLLTAALLVAIAVLSLRFMKRDADDAESEQHKISAFRILWLGSVFSLIGYALAYSFVAEVQNWYTANLIVPLFLFVTLPAASARSRNSIAIGAAGALILLIVFQAVNAASLFKVPEYPHQISMRRAGIYLAQHPPGGKVGSWNAGIIGYYQGGTVINIDGLVNNNIYKFAVKNDLPRYLDEIAIEYIVDFQIMLDKPNYRIRGGYDRPDFLARLEKVRTFDERPDGPLTLYRISPAQDEK